MKIDTLNDRRTGNKAACYALTSPCPAIIVVTAMALKITHPLFAAVLAAILAIPVSGVLAAAQAEQLKAAVFDLEFIDNSLDGEKYGSRQDELRRLAEIGNQLRAGLAGKFQLIDIAPVRSKAQQSHLQACGGCDVQFAQQLGADLAVTGVVQKTSNLILSVSVFVRDTHTDKLIAGVSADMRGNTDESWSRTMSYLLRNRLLAPDYGKPR